MEYRYGTEELVDMVGRGEIGPGATPEGSRRLGYRDAIKDATEAVNLLGDPIDADRMLEVLEALKEENDARCNLFRM